MCVQCDSSTSVIFCCRISVISCTSILVTIFVSPLEYYASVTATVLQTTSITTISHATVTVLRVFATNSFPSNHLHRPTSGRRTQALRTPVQYMARKALYVSRFTKTWAEHDSRFNTAGNIDRKQHKPPACSFPTSRSVMRPNFNGARKRRTML